MLDSVSRINKFLISNFLKIVERPVNHTCPDANDRMTVFDPIEKTIAHQDSLI